MRTTSGPGWCIPLRGFEAVAYTKILVISGEQAVVEAPAVEGGRVTCWWDNLFATEQEALDRLLPTLNNTITYAKGLHEKAVAAQSAANLRLSRLKKNERRTR